MIARNVIYNLAGLVIPVLLAFACIPQLIHALGTTTFGLLTLVWIILGYFSLFDIGIGRALTRILAAMIARGETAGLGTWLRTGAATAAALGVISGAGLALGASWMASKLAPDATEHWPDIAMAIRLVGCALPFVTATAALRGALEARQFFGLTNAIRIGMGFFSYAGPLVVVQYSVRLPVIVSFLLVGRFIFFALHLYYCVRRYPRMVGADRDPLLNLALLPSLFSLSGWMAVSNVVSPILTYLDRLVVAGIVGASVLAYYTTPYEAIMKVTVVPDALNGVLFPVLVASLVTQPERARRLFSLSFRLLLSVMFPLLFTITLLAQPLLALWIGDEFAVHSTHVLQMLALGVMINSLARLPFTLIHSAGRPDITAKLHLVELPIFIGALWLLTHRFGIIGAASAWALRAALDFVLLEVIRRRLVPHPLGIRPLSVVWLAVMAGVGLFNALTPLPLVWQLAAALVGSVLLWAGLLQSDDRQLLVEQWRQRRNKRGQAT